MKSLNLMRRRMRNSRLTGPPFDRPEDAVRWHGAMQAQDYGPAKWSVAQRSTRQVDRDLDRELETGSIVRTHVLRPTWHFVAREDIRWLLALTGPRVQQRNTPGYRDLGLDDRTRARCETLITSALRGGGRLTRKEVARVLEDGGVDTEGQRLPYILMHCELEAAICSGARAGREHTYALLDERVPAGRRLDRDRALVELVRRYLASHGPATVKDLRWWSGLTVADIRQALSDLGSEVVSERVEGLDLWRVASDEGGPSGGGGAHLLQAYDELIVGYAESRYMGDPRAATARAAWKERALPTGVVLVRGRVAGHWRRTIGQSSVAVEVLLYDDPKPRERRALETAADDLGRFLARPATLELRGAPGGAWRG